MSSAVSGTISAVYLIWPSGARRIAVGFGLTISCSTDPGTRGLWTRSMRYFRIWWESGPRRCHREPSGYPVLRHQGYCGRAAGADAGLNGPGRGPVLADGSTVLDGNGFVDLECRGGRGTGVLSLFTNRHSSHSSVLTIPFPGGGEIA